MSLDHLALLADDLDAFVAAVANGPATAEIAGCPGWKLADLGVHLGSVHRWAREAILTGAMPQLDPAADPAPTDLAGISSWVRAGGFGPSIMPSGDVGADMDRIRAFYEGMEGLKAGRFGPVRLREEEAAE